MAVQLHDDDDGEMSEINVTPLVDVMLVLLVVLIVTAPLLTQAVKVKLPKTEQTEPALDQHITILRIDATGQPTLDDQVIALDKLEGELKLRQEKDPELSLQLQADKAAVSRPSPKLWPAASVLVLARFLL